MDTQQAWLRLATTPGIGAALTQRLLSHFGTIDTALAASDSSWQKAGLPRQARAALAEEGGPALQALQDWLSEPQHHFISCMDTRYPRALAELEPPPPWLYAKGDLDLLSYPAIAIVGSRNPTQTGREAAFEFGRALASAGLVVVSGLASGIDAAAHEGALAAQGMTLAVTGTGLDRVYPAANRELAQRIADNGLLISEFELGTQPARGNFPRRNRVLAGLCTATLVVEAARASGSLITARMALAANREVLALPGSIHNPLARGCHQLIREGAKLVETTEHILEEIAGSLAGFRRDDTQDHDRAPETTNLETIKTDAPPSDDEARLLAAIGHDPIRVDELVKRTGWPADAVSSSLLILELEGRIQSQPGGAYMRTAAKA